MGWIDRLFNQHKLIRRLTVLWAIGLITWVTVQVFSELASMTSAVVSALGLIIGLLATAIGLYQWSRNREDKHGLSKTDTD